MKHLLKDFAPWILFGLLVSFNLLSTQGAAVIALLALLILSFQRLSKMFILDWGTLIFFVLISLGPILPFYKWIDTNVSFVSNCALMTIIWISIAARMPFTLQYAKERAPKSLHNSPTFIRTNYILSITWGIVFIVLTGLSIYTSLFVTKSIVAADVAPVVIIVIGIHFTLWYSNRIRKKQASQITLTNIATSREVTLKDGKTLVIRPARKEDVPQIASYIIESVGGIIEFLLHDLMENVTPKQMMQHQIQAENNQFSYLHTTVGEVDGKLVAIAHCFPLSVYKKAEMGMIPQERIDRLKEIFTYSIPGSFYLQAIVVDPEYRGLSIAQRMIDCVFDRAVEHGYSSVCLHVWVDNKPALNLYTKLGFEIVNTYAIERAPLLPHDGGMHLMKKGLLSQRV